MARGKNSNAGYGHVRESECAGAGEDAALLMTKAAFEEFNSELSVFVGESGVARLNAAAGNGDYVKTCQHAVNVLSASSRYYERERWRIQPCVGPLVEAWGFFRGVGPGVSPPDAYVISTNYGAVQLP